MSAILTALAGDRHHHVGPRLSLAQQLLGKRARMQDHSAAQLFRNFDCTDCWLDHLSAHYWLARSARDIKALLRHRDHPPGDWPS